MILPFSLALVRSPLAYCIHFYTLSNCHQRKMFRERVWNRCPLLHDDPHSSINNFAIPTGRREPVSSHKAQRYSALGGPQRSRPSSLHTQCFSGPNLSESKRMTSQPTSSCSLRVWYSKLGFLPSISSN